MNALEAAFEALPDPLQQKIVEASAHAAHEANRAYCIALGDLSQPLWDHAPEWQRESAMKGAEGALRGNSPVDSHALWMEVKIADGWTYGERKDPGAKKHPCLVPYEELPAEQKMKDEIFVGVVRSVAYALGWHPEDHVHFENDPPPVDPEKEDGEPVR